MTDSDSRAEIYRKQDRLEEMDRIKKPITTYTPQNIIGMLFQVSCTDCEAISNIVDFCLKNKDRWTAEEEDQFRLLSWSIDRTKQFLGRAEETFNVTPKKEDNDDWTGRRHGC